MSPAFRLLVPRTLVALLSAVLVAGAPEPAGAQVESRRSGEQAG